MNYCSRAPLIRLIIPFAAGIIVSIETLFFIPKVEILLLSLFIFLTVYTFSPLSGIFSFRLFYALLVYTFLFFSGYFLTNNRNQFFSETHFSKISSADAVLLGQVTEAVVEKEKTYKAIIEVKALKINEELMEAEGCILGYFEKDSLSSLISVNDWLIFKPVYKSIEPPANPGEFNYKKYLSYHQVFHQAYFKSGNWHPLPQDQSRGIMKVASDSRNFLLQIFRKLEISGNEFAVASALIFGFKDQLNTDIVRAYSGAGAMHVLAVSGLHVGIIYLVLNLVLKFIERIKYGFVFKAIIIAAALWAYAFLTGLSPSVMRAATMLTFIIGGSLLKKSSGIYNSLAASAFLLLCINPFLIMEVGFQLSYLAVIGIVYLQPQIYNWFLFKNKIADYVWAITAVSIAAQLATFPLGLLYFHQFPNYFFLSNLIVIPLAFGIIYSGIFLLLISPFELLAGYFAIAFKWLVWLLNLAVFQIEKLPFSITEGVYISVLQTWIIYAVIVTLIAFFVLKRSKYLHLSLVIFSVFLLSRLIDKAETIKQEKLIISNIKGHSAINFIHRDTNILLSDLSAEKDKEKILFHLRNNWIMLGIKKVDHQQIDSVMPILNDEMAFLRKENFYYYKGKNICRISDPHQLKFPELEKKIPVDYLVISKNVKVKADQINKSFQVKKVILDSSNFAKRASKTEEELIAAGIAVYNVNSKGAFVVDL